MTRAPDSLASHACVPVSNTAVPVWGFQKNSIVSPFSIGLGDHVNGGLIELRLRPVYRRNFFAQGPAMRAPNTSVYFLLERYRPKPHYLSFQIMCLFSDCMPVRFRVSMIPLFAFWTETLSKCTFMVVTYRSGRASTHVHECVL